MKTDGVECLNVNCEWRHTKASYGCKRAFSTEFVLKCIDYTPDMPKKRRTPEHEAMVKTLRCLYTHYQTYKLAKMVDKSWGLAQGTMRIAIRTLARNWIGRNRKEGEMGNLMNDVERQGFCYSCQKWITLLPGKSWLPDHENKHGVICKDSRNSYWGLRYRILNEEQALAVAKWIASDDGKCLKSGGLHSMGCADGINCEKTRLRWSQALADYVLNKPKNQQPELTHDKNAIEPTQMHQP